MPQNSNMTNMYKTLFTDDKTKAKAFDLIAEKYYFKNFGSISKADLDLLMFSIYVDQIHTVRGINSTDCSNYNISKQLGITQTRVEGLKEKKELKYPTKGYDWKIALADLLENASYEDGKIKLYLHERTLYNEVKNVIESMGGYTERQLTSNLLQVKLSYFFDLIAYSCNDEEQKKIQNIIAQKVGAENEKINFAVGKSFWEILKNESEEVLLQLLSDLIPMGGTIARLAKAVVTVAKAAQQ